MQYVKKYLIADVQNGAFQSIKQYIDMLYQSAIRVI